MIFVSNVDIQAHKADFHCGIHDAKIIGADLLAQTRYVRGKTSFRPTFIRVKGTILRDGSEAHCLCSTLFNIPGKDIENTLALAKATDEYVFENARDEESSSRPDLFADNRSLCSSF